MAFLLPCSCCKLLGCYFGCCCSAAQSKEWFLDAGRTTPNNKKLPNVSSETHLSLLLLLLLPVQKTAPV